MSTRYGAFLDSYNNGNQFIDKIAQGFFDKISYDLNTIVTGTDPFLSMKFLPVSNIVSQTGRNSYDKLLAVVNILDDASISTANSIYRNNVINIIYILLDVAKATEDSFLIEKSLKIASQVF